MKKTSIFSNLLRGNPYRKPLVWVIAFGLIGTITLLITHAATLSAAFEPEDGTLSGNISKTSDNLGVLFGVAPPTSGGAGCGLTSAAFCDDFSTTYAGGREGDLNPAKWSVTRYVSDDGFSGGANGTPGEFYFPSTPASACKAGVTTFSPDNDIRVCDSASGHQGQILTAINAQHYGQMSMRPRQPFDFAGRTGTIAFNVDAITQGGLSWWPTVFITDQPDSAASNQSQVMGILPKNGLGINFDNHCNVGDNSQGGVGSVYTYNNYAETTISGTGVSCATTGRGILNHIEIRMSQTNFEVWMSDKSTDSGSTFPNLHKVYSANISLNFSRGYVHFIQAERAPAKYVPLGQNQGPQTYANNYWSKIGFDGPVIGTGEVGYPLGDSMTAPSGGLVSLGLGGYDIGYRLPNDNGQTNTFTIPGINLSGVTAAKITFVLRNNYINALTTSSIDLHFNINGGASHVPNPSPNYAAENLCTSCPGPTGGSGVLFAFPIDPAELNNGSNTVTLKVDNAAGSGGWVSAMTGFEILTFTGNAP